MTKLLFILFFFSLTFSLLAQDNLRIVEYEKKQLSKQVRTQKNDYPGDSTIDVKYYKINIALLPSSTSIKSDVTVKLLFKIPANNFFLDLSDALMVDSVFLNDAKTSFAHGKNILRINLPRVYSADDSVTAQIYYNGSPASTGMGSFTFSSYNGEPFIYTLSEPYGAKDWWPCKDTPADKADSADIWITVPQNLTAVSNGTLAVR
ncbi:MAG: hypothetical protein Q8903_10540, partial [Bacteroidota bacterium]|nr:hypothetical protein [Bacteroidota bacterium]